MNSQIKPNKIKLYFNEIKKISIKPNLNKNLNLNQLINNILKLKSRLIYLINSPQTLTKIVVKYTTK